MFLSFLHNVEGFEYLFEKKKNSRERVPALFQSHDLTTWMSVTQDASLPID